MFPISVYIFVSIQLLYVAYIDFKTRKISNQWFFLNIFLFILLTFIFPESYSWSIKSFVFPIAFIFVGFVLFIMNIMGGGDSKYLSSLYLLVPAAHQDQTFIYLLYATVLVGSTLLLFSLLKNLDIILFQLRMGDINGIKRIFGKKFTYAPVIFIAWMWFGWQNYELLRW